MAVSHDGQRFLFLTDAAVDTGGEDAASSQLHVVLDWFEELKARVPSN